MAPDSPTGRRSTEIEITSEMLGMGVRAFLSYDDNYSSPIEAVQNILKATLTHPYVLALPTERGGVTA